MGAKKEKKKGSDPRKKKEEAKKNKQGQPKVTPYIARAERLRKSHKKKTPTWRKLQDQDIKSREEAQGFLEQSREQMKKEVCPLLEEGFFSLEGFKKSLPHGKYKVLLLAWEEYQKEKEKENQKEV